MSAPVSHTPFSGAGCFCGAGFLACGRLSSRPWSLYPLLSYTQSLPRWSKPPGLPCRPLRGASRQACHAGGHAGRATQSRAVRGYQRHPPRTPARSTSSRPLSPHLRILRVLRGLFFSVSSVSSVVCFFSVSSVSCPMWGRLSSLRPAFQPALGPFTHRPLLNPMPRRVGAAQRVRPRCTLWSKPPRLPCRRSRRQSDTILNSTGVPTPSGPQDCALHLNMPPPSGASRQACHADGRGLRLSHPPWCAVPMGNSLKKARPGRAQPGRTEEGRTPSGAKINGIGYEPVPRCCA